MPPHCDTRDGPVVIAAKRALQTGNVNIILPWIPKTAEPELKDAFQRTIQVRRLGNGPMDLADDWFYETAVRLHRQGEGAPYSGLKPSGLDVGPVIPKAEKAIQDGDPKEVIDFLSRTIHDEIQTRFENMMAKKDYDVNDVDSARQYVQAMLGFLLFSHHLYKYIKSSSEGKKIRV
jgi:hypothetical protein